MMLFFYIDDQKAYDTVWWSGLWLRLWEHECMSLLGLLSCVNGWVTKGLPKDVAYLKFCFLCSLMVCWNKLGLE